MTFPAKLLWLDLETTGLDPNEHDILEVAALVAPFDNPFFIDGPHIWTNKVIGYRNWDHVEDRVVEMHAKHGLIADCMTSKTDLASAELAVLELIKNEERGTVMIAGNSVHFDLSFVRRHMRALAGYLHHRIFDVSCVRNFAYALGMPEMPPLEDPPHRAHQDLLASIELGRTLREWFQRAFNLPGPPSIVEEISNGKYTRKAALIGGPHDHVPAHHQDPDGSFRGDPVPLSHPSVPEPEEEPKVP